MKKNLVVLLLISCLYSVKSYAQNITSSNDLNDNTVSVDKDAMNWELSYDFMKTDMGAKQATCTGDVIPPQIFCPQNITQATSTTDCGVRVYFPTLSASDNCSGVFVQCNPPAGSLFANGTTTVTCIATDASNNSTSCSFDVGIIDNVPPQPYCVGDGTIQNDPGVCGAVVTWAIPLGYNYCDDVSISCNPPTGSFLPIGTTTVICTTVDMSGNAAACSSDITVIDTTPGGCDTNCPPIITLDNTSVNGLYHAENSVIAGNTITSGVSTNFKAGNLIQLDNGFIAPSSTNFSAEIEDCPSPNVAPNGDN